jgi:hypothetical protein
MGNKFAKHKFLESTQFTSRIAARTCSIRGIQFSCPCTMPFDAIALSLPCIFFLMHALVPFADFSLAGSVACTIVQLGVKVTLFPLLLLQMLVWSGASFVSHDAFFSSR